ncbi:hypothetical protein HCH_02953 [Hahella chejuensis KCTC 2396]|uniref:Uncharacterized protein n=1 Tax=Hahella chejuensis (strain KCTC 2396) TaxID=349521 RepID=Q2SHZ9_HAHCH|nr:hypothetical protein [Hahella chejuensis]ABC29725.1 hypothetical protein HCH_02953 [Hahella chejuensis KCTC 2396]
MNAPAKRPKPSISQDSLTNFGFKRAFGNAASGYILMFDGVGNESGRRIYIPGGSLGMHFAKLVKMQGEHTEQLILSRLSRLRSCAGGFQSYSNKRDAFEHVDIVENLRISYIIRQDTVGGLGPGIYITDIEFVNHAKGHKPGFYFVGMVDGNWIASDTPGDTVTTEHAAINGMAESLQHAAEETMPKIIAGGYKGCETKIQSKGYTLAYNPRPLYSRGTEWTTPEQKVTSADFTAQLVAKSLYDAQIGAKEVNWTIHGDGADLFLKALNKLPRHFKLNTQTLYFGGPSRAILEILDHIPLREMKLAEEFIKNQSDDYRDTFARTQLLYQVSERVKGLGPEYKLYSFKLRGDARKSRNTALTQGGIALATGLSMGGIIAAITADIPVYAAIAAGVGGASGICNTIFRIYKNAELIRNLFATHTMNPEINPHMNPHMSSSDFNSMIEAKYDGLGKSFIGVMKELGRRS